MRAELRNVPLEIWEQHQKDVYNHNRFHNMLAIAKAKEALEKQPNLEAENRDAYFAIVFLIKQLEYLSTLYLVSEITIRYLEGEAKSPYSSEDMRVCWNAGRDYQAGENSEWHGGPEHNRPNYDKFMKSRKQNEE